MRVLVSGGGIAGLSSAWFLARTDAHVTIVEKVSELLPYGQNIDIDGPARVIVKKMGLWEEIRQHTTTEMGAQFIDPKGQPFAFFPVKEGYTASPTSEVEILRGDLVKILYEATKTSSNVEFKFGTTITNVVSKDDEAIEISFSNGTKERFDLLIAADGQWSTVRKLCFPAESIHVVDKGMYAAFCTIPRQPNDNNYWNIFQALESRLFATRPDPYGTMRAIFTQVPRDEAKKRAWSKASRSDKQSQVAFLRREFADAGWQSYRLLEAMESAPDFYFQAVKQIRMIKWSLGRVVCVGDAGYCPTPLTGMGTSLAIIGGYLLAGELSKLKKGEHPSTAFDAYEKILRPFVEEVQKIPWFIPGILHPDTRFQRWVFGICMSALCRVLKSVVATPWLRRVFRNGEDEKFPFPNYALFDEEGSG